MEIAIYLVVGKESWFRVFNNNCITDFNISLYCLDLKHIMSKHSNGPLKTSVFTVNMRVNTSNAVKMKTRMTRLTKLHFLVSTNFKMPSYMLLLVKIAECEN